MPPDPEVQNSPTSLLIRLMRAQKHSKHDKPVDADDQINNPGPKNSQAAVHLVEYSHTDD
jgi:hypothetical protein